MLGGVGGGGGGGGVAVSELICCKVLRAVRGLVVPNVQEARLSKKQVEAIESATPRSCTAARFATSV